MSSVRACVPPVCSDEIRYIPLHTPTWHRSLSLWGGGEGGGGGTGVQIADHLNLSALAVTSTLSRRLEFVVLKRTDPTIK